VKYQLNSALSESDNATASNPNDRGKQHYLKVTVVSYKGRGYYLNAQVEVVR